jgi:hypothetical protein
VNSKLTPEEDAIGDPDDDDIDDTLPADLWFRGRMSRYTAAGAFLQTIGKSPQSAQSGASL